MPRLSWPCMPYCSLPAHARFRRPATTDAQSFVRAAILFIPAGPQGHRFIDQLRWFRRSWQHMQPFEPTAWRTDIVIFTDGPIPALAGLNCRPANVRTSRAAPNRRVVVSTYHRLALSQHYDFGDSIHAAAQDEPAVVPYDWLLRTDVDTFLTPAFATWRPDSMTVGRGAYMFSPTNLARLTRVGAAMALLDAGLENIGSTCGASTHAAAHLHTWQSQDAFSKFVFAGGGYDAVDVALRLFRTTPWRWRTRRARTRPSRGRLCARSCSSCHPTSRCVACDNSVAAGTKCTRSSRRAARRGLLHRRDPPLGFRARSCVVVVVVASDSIAPDEALRVYDWLLHTDVDTLLTPAVATWLPDVMVVGGAPAQCGATRNRARRVGLSRHARHGRWLNVVWPPDACPNMRAYGSGLDDDDDRRRCANHMAINHCTRDAGVVHDPLMLDFLTTSTDAPIHHAHLRTNYELLRRLWNVSTRD
ncbi:Aste57867_6947 [Aphanomyces stellatus]|uniref:Aste57867_6947 protein n=1 Tax=Aphanomyces stellatus TaxID=120398 RepID=A0A485KHS6_9STRA|nr:hypothetical protein As57867_006925 [Aphanomyces stellatus]VFT83899.1 Aste57867_6947 [Aphanomyces stellatus]